MTIMSDFNAKICRGVQGKIVRRYGSGERNDRGDRLVTFCEETDMITKNTQFKLKTREKAVYVEKSWGCEEEPD